MDTLEQLFPEDLYHSYIVEGNVDNILPLLEEFLIARGYIVPGSQDVLSQQYDIFTIGDSSLIKEWHNNRGGSDTKSICIIGTQFINHDAERTLLKMLEEPRENTHFFIVVPNAQVLLDTIRSRAHIVSIDTLDAIDIYKEAIAFIKAVPKDRIDIVAKLIDENSDGENSGKLRSAALIFINNIEACIYKKFTEDTMKEKYLPILAQLQKNREYLGTPGASVKMILEHIALVI
jgi:DNA polymerase III delta prime subunit